MRTLVSLFLAINLTAVSLSTVPRAAVDLGLLPTAPAPGYMNCPETGEGGDTILNQLKNRSQPAEPSRPTTIDEILHLPSSTQLGHTNPRSDWSPQNLNLVGQFEKTGATVEAYLRRVRQEGKGHCNCERLDLNDFNMWIIANPNSLPAKSVVVEATPRWRGANPNWNLQVLQHLVAQHSRVRITGWLLFDQEHPEQLHATLKQPIIRGTLWEIHPVAKIEVFSNGSGGNSRREVNTAYSVTCWRSHGKGPGFLLNRT